MEWQFNISDVVGQDKRSLLKVTSIVDSHAEKALFVSKISLLIYYLLTLGLQ